jgi:hypothetical protein
LSNELIHIGFPRTGTTWFQQKYFPNVENYLLIDRKIIQDTLIHPSSFNYQAQNFVGSIPVNENIIISEEMITGRIRGGSVNHLFLKENIFRLKASFPKAQYVIFLRNQASLIFSLYKLYIEKGGNFSFKKFLYPENRMQELNLFSADFLNYETTLKFLEKEVGKENIHVFLYEEFKSDPKNFLIEFNKRLSLRVNLNTVEFSFVNSAMPNSAIQIKRFMNRFTRYGIPFKHYYFHLPGVYGIRISSKKQDKRIPVKYRKHMNALIADYKSSNTRVMNRFNLPDIEKFEYPLD